MCDIVTGPARSRGGKKAILLVGDLPIKAQGAVNGGGGRRRRPGLGVHWTLDRTMLFILFVVMSLACLLSSFHHHDFLPHPAFLFINLGSACCSCLYQLAHLVIAFAHWIIGSSSSLYRRSHFLEPFVIVIVASRPIGWHTVRNGRR